ncbi:hypothetical protein BMBphi_gp072 [Bacillus phage vB_BthS_BMBphi]|nr:hypothetical protein BMBphi_gp072 [Bacillus phage vB_BthS_BMBphi]
MIREYLRFRKLKRELEFADKKVKYYTDEIVHYRPNYDEQGLNELLKMQNFWMNTHSDIVKELLK